jgi:hypothetical protein
VASPLPPRKSLGFLIDTDDLHSKLQAVYIKRKITKLYKGHQPPVLKWLYISVTFAVKGLSLLGYFSVACCIHLHCPKIPRIRATLKKMDA